MKYEINYICVKPATKTALARNAMTTADGSGAACALRMEVRQMRWQMVCPKCKHEYTYDNEGKITAFTAMRADYITDHQVEYDAAGNAKIFKSQSISQRVTVILHKGTKSI